MPEQWPGQKVTQPQPQSGWPGQRVEQPRIAPQVDAGRDVVLSVAQGVQDLPGIILGLPGDVQRLIRSGVDAGGRAVLRSLGKSDAEIEQIQRAVEQNRRGRLIPDAPSSADITGAVESVTGFHHEPETDPGRFARTITQFAPAAVAPGSVATRIARVVIPGGASEAAGQATEGTPYEVPARIAAGITGGVVTEMGAAANAARAARRAANPDNAALEQEFGPMTAGERSGSARQRLEEDDLRRGIGSEQAQRTLNAFDDRRVPEIRRNVMGIATRGQEPLSEDLGSAGVAVSDSLRTRVDNMRQQQRALYEDAFKLAQNERVAPTDELISNIDRAMSADFIDAPKARAIIGRLDGEMRQGTATYGTVERARQALNRELSTALRAQDDAAAYGITRIIDELDAFVAPRLSEDASRAVTEARGFTREMMNQFSQRQRTDLATGHQGRSDPGGRAIERVLNTDLTGEQVVDAILGAGTRPSQQALGAVRRIREINDAIIYRNPDAASGVRVPGRIKKGGQTQGERRFAADSPDARFGVELPNPELQGLREALFHRILRPFDTRNEGGMIPAQTVVTNFRRALDGPGAEITKAMFTEREMAAMRRALAYMETLIPPPGAAVSGTSPALSRMISGTFDKLVGIIPGIGPVLREVMENAASTNAARAAVRPPRAGAPRGSSADRPSALPPAYDAAASLPEEERR